MSDTPTPGDGATPQGAPDSPATSAPTPGSPPPTPPPRQGPSLQVFLALGLVAALIAAAVAVVLISGDMTPAAPADGATAGAEPAAAQTQVATGPAVELQLYVARDDQAEPLEAGQDLAVGDQVVFEVTTEEPARVRVWAEVDGLPKQQLGVVELDGGTASVGDDQGLAAWGFGNPGTVVFRASTAPTGCPKGACASWAVIAH